MDEKMIMDLVAKAIKARENAYCKYSGFQVGAVVIGDNGKEYKGVNIENKSYGLTVCAERNAIFSGVGDGMKKIKVIALTADTEGPCTPCGACREVIMEFADSETEVIMSNIKGEYKVVKAAELLPFGFIL